MKALTAIKYGTISDLKYGEIDKPSVEQNEVLVKIKAAAINPADLMVISGKSGGKFLHAANFPFAVGFDYSGGIEEIGGNVSSLEPNDEVFGFLEYSKKNRQGTFTEYVTVTPEILTKKPQNVSFVEAASVGTAGAAALLGLKDKGNLHSGQRVFINGASGGVGSYAVRIANNMGAEVWASCSSKNFDYVKSLGANHVVDYKTMDFRKLSEKFDVFLDAAARTSFSRVRTILSQNGTYVSLLPMSIGFLVGKLKSLLSSKSCRGVIVKPNTSDLSILANWMDEEKLQVSIDASFSLSESIKAFQKFETERVNGKIAIKIDD